MKIVSLILKIAFFWIYIPYLLLKMIFGGSSSGSSSGTVDSNSSNTQGIASGTPLITLAKEEELKYEILKVHRNNAKQFLVKYRERGKISGNQVVVDWPTKQKGPLRIDWSKSVS
tara:strand:+ start:1930 stop:2274 length:345 start_codon:yes stop_codon:yes gene_type:complete